MKGMHMAASLQQQVRARQPRTALVRLTARESAVSAVIPKHEGPRRKVGSFLFPVS